MADPTLAALVTYLREKGNAATDDVFNGITYWTVEQLETILLQSSVTRRVKIKGGNRLSYQIDLPRHWMFSSDVTFQTSAGIETAGDFTYNPVGGRVIFTEEQDDTVLYMVGPAFNLYDALADLWDQKAAQRVDFVNFRAGHNTMDLSDTYTHCTKQRDYYRNKTIRRFQR